MLEHSVYAGFDLNPALLTGSPLEHDSVADTHFVIRYGLDIDHGQGLIGIETCSRQTGYPRCSYGAAAKGLPAA